MLSNLQKAQLALSLVICTARKVSLIIHNQHLLSTQLRRLYSKQVNQVLKVLSLLLADNNKLSLRVVNLIRTQSSLYDIHDIINHNPNLLVISCCILEIYKVSSQALNSLRCKSIGTLCKHNTHLNTSIHSKTHDILKRISLTTLYISQKQTRLCRCRTINKQFINHLPHTLLLLITHKLVMSLHSTEDKLILVNSLSLLKPCFFSKHILRNRHSHRLSHLNKAINLC